MYDFHHKYIEPKYNSKAEFLFTATDSVMYEIKTDDFYKDIETDIKTKFDTLTFQKITKVLNKE